VVGEIKDRKTGLKLHSIDAKILEPKREFVERVKKVAAKTGDLEKLSKTDLDVLALAKELKAVIVSDDYNVQNVAERMGVKAIPVFSRGISKLFVWRKYCPACKKFLKDELNECPVCGTKLKRVPRKKVKIKHE